jgi:hypothetical protein
MQGANALSAEVMARLSGGNPIPAVQDRPLEVDRRLMDPGTAERILGWLSPILGGAGAMRRSPAAQTPTAGVSDPNVFRNVRL